jgi:hypothetical protein
MQRTAQLPLRPGAGRARQEILIPMITIEFGLNVGAA